MLVINIPKPKTCQECPFYHEYHLTTSLDHNKSICQIFKHRFTIEETKTPIEPLEKCPLEEIDLRIKNN